MKTKSKFISTILCGTFLSVMGSTAAFADHNSPNGEGWANMPNDIHNTRIDTREEDDEDEFLDFVQYGAGADTVNRFLTDSTTTSTAGTASATGGSDR